MPATYSTEGKVATTLRELNCSARQFVDLAKSLNVSISHGPFSEWLNGKTRLNDSTVEKLIELSSELKDLCKRFADIPIDWAATERIANLVVLMRVEIISAELDSANSNPK